MGCFYTLPGFPVHCLLNLHKNKPKSSLNLRSNWEHKHKNGQSSIVRHLVPTSDKDPHRKKGIDCLSNPIVTIEFFLLCGLL